MGDNLSAAEGAVGKAGEEDGGQNSAIANGGFLFVQMFCGF